MEHKNSSSQIESLPTWKDKRWYASDQHAANKTKQNKKTTTIILTINVDLTLIDIRFGNLLTEKNKVFGEGT